MQDEILQSEWAAYFKAISERHAKRSVRLETFGELGAQEEAHSLPLAGISVEMDGTDAPRVQIMLGGLESGSPRHLTHTVMRVSRVMRKLSPDGREDALELEGEDGAQQQQTLLHFETRAELMAAQTS